MSLTRRVFLRHSAAAGVTVATAAAPAVAAAAAPTTPELPVERVVRLAKELSKALDALNEEAFMVDYGGTEVAIMTARVWPSLINPNVCLEETDVPVAMVRFALAVQS